MPRRDVPEPWATAMREAGVGDPRNGHPSWSALGRKIGGVHASTLIAMADGSRATDRETIAAVAKALKLDAREVAAWIPRATAFGEIYEGPSESRLLTDDERSALSTLIKAIAKSRTAEPGEVRQDATVSPLPARAEAAAPSPDTSSSDGIVKRAARQSTKPPKQS